MTLFLLKDDSRSLNSSLRRSQSSSNSPTVEMVFVDPGKRAQLNSSLRRSQSSSNSPTVEMVFVDPGKRAQLVLRIWFTLTGSRLF